MATYRITAKRTLASGGKGIMKGMSVIMGSQSGATPNLSELLEAFNKQLGVPIKGFAVSKGDFEYTKI